MAKLISIFLRGFNLDHGTDFATVVDGMPLNFRSHGHGHGYTDLNFLIPETIGLMTYKKGAYYSEIGDFSGAGGVNVTTADRLTHNQFNLRLGEDGYQRVLAMFGLESAKGNSLIALERQHYDGPWTDIDEDVLKSNALLKHTIPLDQGQVSLTLMAYDNQWNSADQIPTRAVQQSIINELGSIDDTVGGTTSRYSLSVNAKEGDWHASAYVIDYDLILWSNFTYFLDDEVNGDQFEQVDKRKIYGGHIARDLNSTFADNSVKTTFGLQFQIDDISEVGLYQTKQRKHLGVTRSDKIDQSSVSLYWQSNIEFNQRLRAIFGARYDVLDFEVQNIADVNRFGVVLNENSGKSDDDLFSLKGSLTYLFNDEWEGYVSAGQGFHSNDARGTTIAVDPSSGMAVEQVDPLVRSTGFELGVRGFIGKKLNLSASLWSLRLDSELLFVGDAGNTEASSPSQREGIELAAYMKLNHFVSADLEYAYADSKFRVNALEGDQIPGAVGDVIQAGINLTLNESWSGSLRYRYFGERPLIEDGLQESGSTSTLNMKIGYAQEQWLASLDVLNITDRNDHDIDYFYESRLFNEPQGVVFEDIHYHPIEPRTVRLSLGFKF